MKKIQKLRVSFAKFKVFSLFNMEEVEIIVEEKPSNVFQKKKLYETFSIVFMDFFCITICKLII